MIYVHEFKVRMMVDVDSPTEAERWLGARLHGGDASFETAHVGKVALTEAESDAFEQDGVLPERLGEWPAATKGESTYDRGWNAAVEACVQVANTYQDERWREFADRLKAIGGRT